LKAVKAIILYTVVVFVLGALLAPWVFRLVRALPIAYLADKPFRRVFDRTLLVIALAGLWPLLRGLGIRSWSAVGYPRGSDWWRMVLLGVVVGCSSLALAFALSDRHMQWDAVHARWGGVLLKVVLTAVLVALIEETFFRGGLQGALQRGLPAWAAVMLSSVIYSALHFLKPYGFDIAADAVTWHSGFDYLGQMLHRSFTAANMPIAFVTLLLVGMILGWAFYQTSALYLPIGLHGGWVVTNEFIRKFKGGNISETTVAWGVLLLVWLVLAGIFRVGCFKQQPHRVSDRTRC
jgi:membrane protease YdiL (CAAX protease family)